MSERKVQGAIIGLTEFIESLLVPAFLMLFAIAVSGYHIYKFVEAADGMTMGVVMGVGISMMTIFFANRTLRPHGRERVVAMGFLAYFATMSTIWQFLYQQPHFEHWLIALSVASVMPIAEIGLGVTAALQKGKHAEPTKPPVVEQAVQAPEAQPAAHPAPETAAPEESVPVAKPTQVKRQSGKQVERMEFGNPTERRRYVEQWLTNEVLADHTPDEWPQVATGLNVAELTRRLEQVVKAGNRTLRRDVDAAIERFIVDARTVDGELLTQEIHVSMNGKGH